MNIQLDPLEGGWKATIDKSKEIDIRCCKCGLSYKDLTIQMGKMFYWCNYDGKFYCNRHVLTYKHPINKEKIEFFNLIYIKLK